jgi:hypothetical protein
MEGGWRAIRRIAPALLGAAATFCVGCGDSGDDSAGPDPVRPVATSDPATAFAPLVRLHPDEQAFPIGAERFLVRATLKWRDGPCYRLADIATGRIGDRKTATPVPRLDPARLGGVKRPYWQRRLNDACDRRVGRRYLSTELTRPYNDAPTAAGLADDEGFYLDVLSDSRDGDPRFVQARDGTRLLTGAPAYYRSEPTPDGRRAEIRLSYWMFYARSEITLGGGDGFSHEGDWEEVRVLARRMARDRWLPLSIDLGREDGRMRTVPWRSVERHGSHPVVFSAEGSHASYARPGRHRATVEVDGRGTRYHDSTATCDSCVAWRTWANLRPLDRQPWRGFGGGWGLGFQTSATSGPLGPEIGD